MAETIKIDHSTAFFLRSIINCCRSQGIIWDQRNHFQIEIAQTERTVVVFDSLTFILELFQLSNYSAAVFSRTFFSLSLPHSARYNSYQLRAIAFAHL